MFVRIFACLILISFCENVFSQNIHSNKITLKWQEEPVVTETSGGLLQQYLIFEGAKMRGEKLRMLPE